MNCPCYRQCPPRTSAYIVKPGDTLYKLARQYNTSVAAIISVNPYINPGFLVVGQQICIPSQPVYPPCPEGNYYAVKSGDTLTAIARFYNVSVDDLIEANPGIDPYRMAVGQIICIPLATPPFVCIPGTQRYTARQGDTFYSIAKRFNTTIRAMTTVNPGINPNALLIGQTLCVPANQDTYANLNYNINFLYPVEWKRIDDTRYEGPTGFFQISAIASAGSLGEVCRNEAFHQLNPYGTNPAIKNGRTMHGYPYCIIHPSSDQPQEMKEQGAIIMQYPNPITISGQKYKYLIVWTDKDYAQKIAGTLRLLI